VEPVFPTTESEKKSSNSVELNGIEPSAS
jgi:hypothetical protein